MSGEYYGTDECHTKFYKDYDTVSIHSNEKYGQDHNLNDIEEQLEDAETRCNTLKDQLDYMKEVYGVKQVIKSGKSRKHSLLATNRKESDENLSNSSSTGSTDGKKNLFKRQTPTSIGTDNTGDAVNTINNILNGITNSVNRLSDLHIKISDTPRSRVASAKTTPFRYSHDVMASPGSHVPLSDPRRQGLQLIEPANLHLSTSSSKSIPGNKSRNIKKRFKDPRTIKKKGSAQIVTKTVKVDKKMMVAKTAPEGSFTSTRHTPFANSMSNQAKLVELFHNKEAKSSDSDDGQGSKTKNADCEIEPIVPLLELPNSEDSNEVRLQNKNVSHLTQKEYYDPPEAPRSILSCFQKKLPAAHYSFQNETSCQKLSKYTQLQTISTSPSHNIGINIQQVMNILKNRQPINGISPTLAHNIGLAAERLNSRPLSTLVSTINSKTCYVRPQQCPLSKCNLNYKQLQDLAKSIPEETPEEVEGEDGPEMKTVIITGPSGDMEFQNKNMTWAIDSTNSTECTCLPQVGNDINYVANKFKRPGKLIPSQISIQSQPMTRWHPNPKSAKRPHTNVAKLKKAPVPKVEKIEKVSKVESENHLIGKEKNLKEVLVHLHDEFEQLNQKYDNLSKTATTADDQTSKEMVRLEEELNKKEEEITMVMSLCKEVMALKRQIKALKKISSACSVSQEPKDGASFNDYNNPQAAFHLTKLLKQIQTYQTRYKNGVKV